MNADGVGLGKVISQHFSLHEYKCPCGRPNCDAPILPPDLFLSRLEKVREEYGEPIIAGSWARCDWYNKKIKDSAKMSQHLFGNAMDISYRNLVEIHKLVTVFMKHGFTVILYSSWIHVDLRKGEPLLMRGRK